MEKTLFDVTVYVSNQNLVCIKQTDLTAIDQEVIILLRPEQVDIVVT